MSQIVYPQAANDVTNHFPRCRLEAMEGIMPGERDIL